eukprot:239441-Chlamydomonas_euryale.AAC.7
MRKRRTRVATLPNNPAPGVLVARRRGHPRLATLSARGALTAGRCKRRLRRCRWCWGWGGLLPQWSLHHARDPAICELRTAGRRRDPDGPSSPDGPPSPGGLPDQLQMALPA